MKSAKYNYKLIFSVFAVNLLAFAAGNAYAWSSSVLIILRSEDPEKNPLGRPATSPEKAWIASLISLGASAGPFLAGYCSDKFGRKKTLLAFAVPMLMSHIILSFATKPIEFFIARFMMGLGAGCMYTVNPIYVAEVAETEIRGLLGFFLAFLQTLGMLLVYATGPFVDITTLSYILMLPLGLFFVLFGLFVPESPYYLISKNQITAAESSLEKLRRNDSCAVLKELADMRQSVEESSKGGSLSEVLQSRSFVKGITISVALMIIQQSSAITIILCYLQSIFDASGSSMSASTSAIIVAVIQVISVSVSSFLVDRWGRKILLILSVAGVAFSLFALGLFFYMKQAEMNVSYFWWLPVSSLVFYMIAYNFGLGPLPFALVGELFSSRTKAFASSMSAFTTLILSFILTFIYPMLEEAMGSHGVFWLFSFCSVLGLLFVLWYVPETKGKNFQDILLMLEK